MAAPAAGECGRARYRMHSIPKLRPGQLPERSPTFGRLGTACLTPGGVALEHGTQYLPLHSAVPYKTDVAVPLTSASREGDPCADGSIRPEATPRAGTFNRGYDRPSAGS